METKTHERTFIYKLKSALRIFHISLATAQRSTQPARPPTCNLQYEGKSPFGLALWITLRAEACKTLPIKNRPN
jgi:hypothetical protein